MAAPRCGWRGHPTQEARQHAEHAHHPRHHARAACALRRPALRNDRGGARRQPLRHELPGHPINTRAPIWPQASSPWRMWWRRRTCAASWTSYYAQHPPTCHFALVASMAAAKTGSRNGLRLDAHERSDARRLLGSSCDNSRCSLKRDRGHSFSVAGRVER